MRNLTECATPRKVVHPCTFKDTVLKMKIGEESLIRCADPISNRGGMRVFPPPSKQVARKRGGKMNGSGA